MSKATCVLVHGAWHGGWSWDKLMAPLEAAGVTAIAPDLPGHGACALPLAKVTLARYADKVTEIVEAIDGPVVLVGHSMGGTVLSEVAERIPDKLQTLVYLTAFLLPDGMAMAVRMKEDKESAAARFSQKLPDAPAIAMAEEGLRTAIYNGCRAEDIDWAVAKVRPQAIAPMVTPVHVSAARFGRVPRVYIECNDDRALTLAMQRRMQQDWPCSKVITLASGHVPQVQMPDQLAAVLATIIEP